MILLLLAFHNNSGEATVENENSMSIATLQIKTDDMMATGDFALVISIINSVLILAVLMEG